MWIRVQFAAFFIWSSLAVLTTRGAINVGEYIPLLTSSILIVSSLHSANHESSYGTTISSGTYDFYKSFHNLFDDIDTQSDLLIHIPLSYLSHCMVFCKVQCNILFNTLVLSLFYTVATATHPASNS